MATVNMVNEESVAMNGNGAGRSQSAITPSVIATIMDVTNGLTHMALGAVAFTAIAYANILDLSSSLTQHIYLCVLGYVILMAHGILSISPHTGWAKTLNFRQKRVVHMWLHIVGSTLAIAGSIVRIVGRGLPFSEVHGSLGIIAMIFTILSLIGGLLHYFFNMPRLARLVHYLCGILTLTIAFVCLIFGFHHHSRGFFGHTTSNFVIATTVFALLGSLVSACAKSSRMLFK